MTFTLTREDIYFVICLVLLAVQIYQGYLSSRLNNRIEELGQIFTSFMISATHTIEKMQKEIKDLESKLQSKS